MSDRREHCRIALTIDLDCPFDLPYERQIEAIKAYFERTFEELQQQPQLINPASSEGIYLIGGTVGAFQSEAEIYGGGLPDAQ